MITKTLSFVEAVEGGMPTSSLNPFAILRFNEVVGMEFEFLIYLRSGQWFVRYASLFTFSMDPLSGVLLRGRMTGSR